MKKNKIFFVCSHKFEIHSKALLLFLVLLMSEGCKTSVEQNQNVTITYGLYDNFDGQGCRQDIDGSQMAIAGDLSQQIWLTANYSNNKPAWLYFPVVQDDASHGFVCNIIWPQDPVPSLGRVNSLILNHPDEVMFDAEVSKLTSSFDFKVVAAYTEGMFRFYFGQYSDPKQKTPIIELGYVHIRFYLNDDLQRLVLEANSYTYQSLMVPIVEKLDLEMNRWYNLKVELIKTGANAFLVNLYLDSVQLAGVQIENFLNTSVQIGISRFFQTMDYRRGFPFNEGQMLIDNLYAEYSNKTK